MTAADALAYAGGLLWIAALVMLCLSTGNHRGRR